MSQPPGEPPAEPPPPPFRQPPDRPGPGPVRFRGSAVAGGVVTGIVAPVLVAVLFAVIIGVLNGRASNTVPAGLVSGLGLLLGLGPLVLGIVLASRHGSATRRGFGLGLAIGWGCFVIIGGGLCLALIAQLGGPGDAGASAPAGDRLDCARQACGQQAVDQEASRGG